MKKQIILIIIFTILICLLVSCSNTNNNLLEFTFDENGSYTGFENLLREYTVEKAEEDGCVIRKTGGIGIVENENLWDKFVKNTSKGKEASLRMVDFADDSDYPYITDVFYRDGAYYLFDSTAYSFTKEPYRYLLILEGKFGNPLKKTSIVILSDDHSLTFDEVMKTLYSSNMGYIKSISDYQLVMFQ